MTLEMIQKIHCLPDVELSETMKLHLAASMRGAEDIARVKARLDHYFLANDWSRLVTTVLPLDNLPSIVANFVFAPDFDFEGRYLQDFEDFSRDLEMIFVTITPAEGRGYALFSHFDTATRVPRDFISSLLHAQDLSSALLWFVLGHAENIAISPAWFDGLRDTKRKLLIDHFRSNANPFDAKINQLKDYPHKFANWNPNRSVQI